jgi:SLT domain-containing protein
MITIFILIILKAAACRVLMYFWNKEAPKDILDSRSSSINVPHSSSQNLNQTQSGKYSSPFSNSSNQKNQNQQLDNHQTASKMNASIKIKFSDRSHQLFKSLVLRVW